MWKPINRTTVQTEENEYRLYAKQGPINYKKPDGTFDTIDHTFNDTTSSIGEISLMDKGIMSVGKRKGNNPHKVVGVRPDINQHLGTQQLEFSLVNVELDGESQSFNVETDLEIKLGPAQVWQLVKTHKDFNDFKIEFDIHTTGLEIQNSKYSSTTTLREDFDFNLTNLGEIEGGNTSLSKENVYNNSSGSILQKNTPYLDFYVSQITNDYIQTGEYSIEEEFGDSDLSSYTLESMYERGSSIYFKDSIVLNVKSYQLENVEDIVINNLCDLYGLEVFDDGGAGKYFTKNNKKVGAYLIPLNSDEFYVMFNTKEIPDNIKTLFKKKTFNDTSYLDITLSDFSTAVTNQFNKNIKIELDTDYYEPINNKFHFKIKNNSFHINLPILYDESYNALNLGTTHSLKQNSDGSYRYTKYFSTDGYLKNSHNIKYIDVDLSTNTDEVRSYYIRFPAGSTNNIVQQYNVTNLAAARNATTAGASFAHTTLNTLLEWTGWYQARVVSQFSTSYNARYTQTPVTFDTSGISAAIDTATLKIRGGYQNTVSSDPAADHHLIALKADLSDVNDLGNFNDLTGHTSGWDDTDVTEYSAEHIVTDVYTSPAFQDITLNSDAKTDIQNTSEVEIMLVEKEEYYDNSHNPHSYSAATSIGRRFMANSILATTTSLRPFLQYTEVGGVSGYTHKVVGVAAANIGKVKGVTTANIGKVIGVD